MERFLTPEEVADRLAVNPKTIRKWLADGKLKGVKAGRLWRISPEAVYDFLARFSPSEKAVREVQEREEASSLRLYTRKEIQKFLEEDQLRPELAQRVESLLGP